MVLRTQSRQFSLGLLDHARDQIDIDLRKAELARAAVSAPDFLRAVSASVDLQDVIGKIFDAETKARDAQLADRLELVVRERARLAFEGHLLDFIPRQQRLHAVG